MARKPIPRAVIPAWEGVGRRTPSASPAFDTELVAVATRLGLDHQVTLDTSSACGLVIVFLVGILGAAIPPEPSRDHSPCSATRQREARWPALDMSGMRAAKQIALLVFPPRERPAIWGVEILER